MYVLPPMRRNGKWVVVTRETNDPMSKDIEVIVCSSREDCYQTYRAVKKELGQGL